MGPKGVNHEEVESLFKDELNALKNGTHSAFYCGKSKEMINAYCDIFVTVMDQPERRSSNYVGLGNSQFHSRFGVCLDAVSVKKVLPPCSRCLDMLICAPSENNQPFFNTTCHHCTCWVTTCNPLLDSDAPSKFPKDFTNTHGKLSPGRISYQSLIESVRVAHDRIVSGCWTTEVARLFMRSRCLNGNAIEGVIENAINCLNFRLLEENQAEEPDAFSAIVKEKDRHSELFMPWSLPSFWTRGLDLSQNVEAPMHLFSGVTKTVVRSIQNWAAMRGTRSSFLQYASNLLDPIQELQLSWCKCLSYTGGKLPGWVSENYIALSRVSAWFYSGLGYLAQDPVFEDPTHLPQQRWLKKHNHGWLKARGLDNAGSAEELRNRVAGLLSHPDGPPALVGPTGGPVDGVKEMIVSLYRMMSHLMAPSFSQQDTTWSLYNQKLPSVRQYVFSTFFA